MEREDLLGLRPLGWGMSDLEEHTAGLAAAAVVAPARQGPVVRTSIKVEAYHKMPEAQPELEAGELEVTAPLQVSPSEGLEEHGFMEVSALAEDLEAETGLRRVLEGSAADPSPSGLL